MTLSKALKGLLLTVSGLILAPLVGSFVTGPILPWPKIVMSLAVAAAISAPAYIPMFRAAMSETAIMRLNTISLNPWVWTVLIAVFWLYIAAWPISNYYAQQVAIHTVDRTKVLSTEERTKYKNQIDRIQGMLNVAFGVEMADDQKVTDLSTKLDATQKQTNTNLDEIEKRDWIQEAVHSVAEIETAQQEQAIAHSRFDTCQQNHPHGPCFILAADAAAIDGKLQRMQAYPDELKKQLKAKLEVLRIQQDQ